MVAFIGFEMPISHSTQIYGVRVGILLHTRLELSGEKNTRNNTFKTHPEIRIEYLK